MREYLRDIARSVAFLSRIPVPSSFFEGDDGKLSRVSRAFPVAGLLIALPSALTFSVLLALNADPLMAALLALAVHTLLTGALHEDALSDTADGLSGGKDRERALEIMKDSRIGTYGAAALILSFGLRAAALAAIARHLSPEVAAVAILAAATLSRGAMVWHWYALPSAKPDGIAASAGKPDGDAMQLALLATLGLAVLLVGPAMGVPALVGCLLATSVAAFLATRYIRQKLTGHTGDTIGATQQICEIASLCTLAMCV
ncbi:MULTISPECIES: adenosylcobinamide-GDP ribazoletransferase [unclassified Rhizobium]|uniref:adenosylcobinamide-GDP ribazoletransferase n=1 Tax=unclassified Rhizobium TaxID=2613769 RepID=UPI0016170E4D|nr:MULTISPECIES: adenosylcobinamide-GDP ribazoletransferase [unclassified Rhizobium]MBB3382078.1 adenosylcobinamide-GDP ribazoletransferase [Rhizobium sp. BK098]MBB3613780.1 adenosylcobinamide-GDP ribazoletransferase [Rhizobium sp. BK609]MBB3679438.1 adenosylcobinamide-GDP ribazoletransferase [Rhizobium sp. BK612]